MRSFLELVFGLIIIYLYKIILENYIIIRLILKNSFLLYLNKCLNFVYKEIGLLYKTQIRRLKLIKTLIYFKGFSLHRELRPNIVKFRQFNLDSKLLYNSKNLFFKQIELKSYKLFHSDATKQYSVKLNEELICYHKIPYSNGNNTKEARSSLQRMINSLAKESLCCKYLDKICRPLLEGYEHSFQVKVKQINNFYKLVG